MTIYDNVKEIERKIDLCFNAETGEIDEELERELITLKNEILESGLENLCFVRANMKARIEAMKNEEKRIKEKREKEENNLERLESYMMLLLKESGQDKYNAGTFTVSTRKSSSVVLDDNFTNDKYQTTETITKTDKIAIKKAIQNGEAIEGAIVQENINLSVK